MTLERLSGAGPLVAELHRKERSGVDGGGSSLSPDAGFEAPRA